MVWGPPRFTTESPKLNRTLAPDDDFGPVLYDFLWCFSLVGLLLFLLLLLRCCIWKRMIKGSSRSVLSSMSVTYIAPNQDTTNDNNTSSHPQGYPAGVLMPPHQAQGEVMDDDAETVKAGDRACTICFEKKADSVFQGCNHLAACLPCAQRTVSELGQCPICRTPCLAAVKIFDATETAEAKPKENERVRNPGTRNPRQPRKHPKEAARKPPSRHHPSVYAISPRTQMGRRENTTRRSENVYGRSNQNHGRRPSGSIVHV